MVGSGGQRDDGIDHCSRGSQPDHLSGIVGEEAHGSDPELSKDRRALAVVAGVDGQPERDIGVDRVGTGVLGHVGAKLVHQADSSSLVTGRVHQDATPLRSDQPQSGTELDAAVATQRSEGVARQALGVESHEHVVAVGDVAHDHRHVDVAGGPLERVHIEHAVRRRQRHTNGFAGDRGGGDHIGDHAAAVYPDLYTGKLTRWRPVRWGVARWGLVR